MNVRNFFSFAAPLAVALLVSAGRADASVLVNKAFSPTSVQLGVTSAVTITLSNTSTVSAANVTSLSDDIATMGGKATIASPSNIVTTCAGGTASIAGTVVSLAGGVIPAAADSTHPGTCTVTFNVVGASVGNGINSIAAGALVTDQGTNATAASQTLQVLTATLAVTGSATTSQLSTATATQTFTVTNPTASDITNATFPITFTNGGGSTAQYTMASGSTGSCAGSVTPSSFTSTNANPSVGTATVTGLTIPANGSCTVTLTLTDPVAATSVSASGTLAAAAISDDQGITNGTSATGKSQFFNGLASLSKSFTPSTVVAGTTSRMSIVIKNTQLVALTSAAITDTLPTNMTLDAAPAAAYTNCGTPALSGAGTGTLGITGATVAATTTLGTAVSASTCTIVVTVDTAGGSTGSLVNNIPAANFSNTQNVAASGTASATLTISTGALTATKVFSAGTTVRNVPVTETLTFSNGSGSALTNGSFTDNLPQTPVAMQYYSAFTPTFTNCGSSTPTVTASGGNTIVSGSNLTVPASSSCVVKFQVTLASGGYPQQTDTNTIPTANVTFTDSGSNLVHPGAQLSATLATLPAFTIKNFVGPNYSGVANQPVAVQGQIVYSPSTGGLVTDTNVSATFVLNPAGQHNLALASAPNYQFTGCPNGTSAANVTAAGNGESFVLALPSISATCTITYNVVNENTIAPPSATYGSGIDSYTSTENGGTSTSNAQSYTVTFYTTSLLVNKVFTPNSIASGGTATAKFTLDVAAVPQLSSTQANGVAFTDSLPANMTFAGAPNVTLSAGCTQTGQPTATGTPSGTTISFANISLLAGTDCVATFDVTSNYLGNTTNTIAASAITSTSGATNTQSASASLTVVAGVALQKTFLNSAFAIGTINYVRFLIVNSSSGVLGSGTLTDNMPATLALSSLTAQPPAQGGDPASCGGTVTGTVGSSTFQLSGMSVAGASGPGNPGECVQYVQVTASGTAAPGSVVNSIPAGALDIGGQVNLTGASTPPATLSAAPNATVTQAFSPASIVQGGTSTLTITIANTSSLAAALSGVALTDTLPAGVTVAAVPNAATTCGAGTVTAVAGSASAALASGTLAANASCTISFSVTSVAAAAYTNTLAAGALATTQGATNAQTTATLTVTAAPNVTLTKAIAPAAIAPGGTAVLTLTIGNTAGSADALSAIGLTDALPSGMTVASSPGASTTCPGGTLTANAGATSAVLSGATLAVSASCTVTLNVTASTVGSYTNTIAAGALTSTQGASNATAATATLSVLSLALAQAFAPASIAAGATSVLTITIPNTESGAVLLSGIALSDALPPGLTVASTPNASTTCTPGTVTATAGGTSVALAGGILSAGGTCTVSVSVTATTAAVYANTIAANALSTAQGISNASPVTADLTVTNNGITLAKAFAPASITAGASSVLTITIPNTAPGAVPLAGMALTDTLPSGLTIAATPAASTSCNAGSVSAVAGGSSVALTGGNLAAGQTCTVTVSVTGSVAATYTNTIAAGALSTAQSITNPAPATATLTIVSGSLALTKAFTPSTIGAGGTSTLTITLSNTAPGAVTLTALGLTDTLPAGVTIASVPAASTTCGGSPTATAGSSSVSVTGGTVAAAATCTLVVNVTSTALGAHVNTIASSALADAQSVTNSAPASATLTVIAAPVTLTKSFAPASIAPGGTSVLTVSLANTAIGAAALTSVGLVDTFPAGLVVAAVPNAATTCSSGTATAVAGATSLTLAGAALAANATCTVTVAVTSATPGSPTNTIAAGTLTSAQGATNSVVASATLTVATAPVTIAQAFAPASIVSGATSVLTITFSNTAPGASALTAVALSDALPAGMKIASVPNAATTCGSGALAAVAGSAVFGLSSASLGANATCTMSVNVTSSTIGVATNTIAAGALSSTQGVSNALPATATLTVGAAPSVTLAQAFAPAIIGIGGVSVYTITIANTTAQAVALSAIALGDTLPAGTFVAPTPDAATTCAGGAVTAAAGATQLNLAGATLAANASCTISVNVTGPAVGTFVDTIAAHALSSAQGASNAVATQATLTIASVSLQVSKTSTAAGTGVAPGGTVTYTIVVKNTGAVAETQATIADHLANATFVPGSLTVNGTAAPDGVLLASAPFGSIAPGASATLVYTALVAATAVPGTSLTNSVSAGGDLTCAGATCTAVAAPVAIVAPVLTIVITIDGQQTETVVPGQVVTYAMTVTNTSSVTATSVNLVNTAPDGAVPIAGTVTLGGMPFSVARSARVSQATSSVNGQVVTVPIGTLAAGANVVVTFQARIEPLTTTRLVDSASVGANGLPSVVVSNEVAAVMVAGALHMTKTASAAVATVGDRVNYLITVAPPTGTGLGATTIVDTLPPYEAYAPGTARVAGAALEPAIAGRVLTWTLPALTAPTTISYATAITAGAQPQSLLTNVVTGNAASLRGAPASTGRASASVQIVGTTFGSCYPITGRVFIDVHDTGRFADGDRGVAGVRIVMEDGESVVTDAEGRYDFPCVAQGMHALRLDTASLPPGVSAFDDRRLDSPQSTRRLIHAALDATILQDINFAVRPPPANF